MKIKPINYRMNDYSGIIQGCIRKDRQAQLDFYGLFCDDVYRSCIRILGNEEEAEEVMQETFLKILERPRRYDVDETGMRRILRRMAANGAIDRCRKRSVRFAELDDNCDYDFPEDTEPLETLAPEIVYKAVDRLPDGYRTVFNLHLIEEMEFGEIARKLGITPSSVRSQYARARKKLVEMIKNCSTI